MLQYVDVVSVHSGDFVTSHVFHCELGEKTVCFKKKKKFACENLFF